MELSHSLRPDRNLAMELVRVTEGAAISAARYMGRGDKIGGDQAAVDAMRAFLSTVEMNGVVVIGEGEKDEAPMLFNGERVGTGNGAAVDVAVDPVEGTRLLADGRHNAIAAIAVSERNTMWQPGSSLYMNKLVVGKKARHAIDIRLSAQENLLRIADALERPVHDLTVFILDKPRHQDLIAEIRAVGARITLQPEGDVIGALLAAAPHTGVDVLMGIGGTPECVLAAAAVKALDGGMQCMRAPQLDYERARLLEEGCDLDEVLTLNTLITSDNTYFAATGITGGTFLEEVRFEEEQMVTTHSIVIRSKTGSIRFIKGVHNLHRKQVF